MSQRGQSYSHHYRVYDHCAVSWQTGRHGAGTLAKSSQLWCYTLALVYFSCLSTGLAGWGAEAHDLLHLVSIVPQGSVLEQVLGQEGNEWLMCDIDEGLGSHCAMVSAPQAVFAITWLVALPYTLYKLISRFRDSGYGKGWRKIVEDRSYSTFYSFYIPTDTELSLKEMLGSPIYSADRLS